MASDPTPLIALPAPDGEGRLTLERAIGRRRSIRAFGGGPVPLAGIGQILWAGQGVTGAEGLRAVPSAGALHPLELHAVTAGGADLDAGIYRYLSARHALRPVAGGDFRAGFAMAAFGQDWVRRAGLIVIVAAVPARVTGKYGERGRRYIAIEAGHCAQNICLQATARGLGATELGAFGDAALSGLLHLPEGEEPVTSVVIGQPG
ncbi:SagB/ThcOx family dehydrogenase [Actibacterium sp. MT2.3-13A]|uniref:SagB/ThcOx family dehydrogenase n=1 Tax=Actibacterium sp. MT2.3-13A TaxID=2828332 RepID=UPI001BA9801F|nr:SagB/ThcOx family dehydrogenase [Actibacterium sp. MT2.3-13A]